MANRKGLEHILIASLTLIIGIVLLGNSVLPAQAQGYVVDLDLSGEGAISWEISNIKPGDSGTKTIELNNNGNSDGFVSIWIGEINETDHGSDGASLGKYLLLNLSGERMEANMSFPSTIDGFPQNTSDLKYISITHIGTGEVIYLDFEWEFQMTNTSQNEAQGDELSFNIYFMLEELPPSEGEIYKSHNDDTLLNITNLSEKYELTLSDGLASMEIGLEGIYEDVIINDNDKKRPYNKFGLLLLILTGSILIAKKKFRLF